MSDVNLEEKAQQVTDLAIQGQGCALQREIQSLSKNDTEAVWALAQNKADKAVTASGQFPYVEFVNAQPDKGYFSAMAIVIDPSRDTLKTKILDETKGFIISGASHFCLDLKKKT